MSQSSESSGASTDPVLVDRIRDGDEDALSVLYRRYVTDIYRFVLAQVRNVADAEDLTSETFARMIRGIGGFRGDASFKNWLYQIARNAIRNHRRRASYRRSLPLSPDLIDETQSHKTSSPAGTGNTERALELLKPLPPRYRRVLELRFLDGRTIKETASIMQISVSNAKVLQHRALKKAAALKEETVDV